MGGAMGKVGNVFTGNQDQIGDSGFSVGDMKDMGYDKSQISDMGPTKPGAGTTAARGILRGVGTAFGNGLQKQANQQPTGGVGSPIVPPTTQVTAPSTNPYEDYLTRMRKPTMSDDPTMGGMAGYRR